MKKRLVIFDCFGVIFGEIGPRIVRKYAKEGDDIPAIKEKLFLPADLGKVSYDELISNIAEEFGVEKQSVLDDWNSFVKLNEELVSLIEKIRETATVALLSNASKGFVESLFEKYNLTHLFDEMVISSNIGMAKPDKEIYKYCVSRFDCQFDEIYMIDDNAVNLDGLETIGITPVLFKGNESIGQIL